MGDELAMKNKFLLSLDVGPMGALWRAAVGAAFTWLMSTFLPGAGTVLAVTCLAGILFTVKAAAAVGRRVSGAAPRVREQWTARRAIASHWDSYQWRKLVWFGTGILVGWATAGARPPWAGAVGIACFSAGVGGEVVWRRLGAAAAPPNRS